MTFIIKPTLYTLLFISSIQVAFSQNKSLKFNDLKTIVKPQEIGGPLQITENDIEEIISMNAIRGRNEIELYAWSKWLGEIQNVSKYIQILKYIKSKLTEEQIHIAEDRYQIILKADQENKILDEFSSVYPDTNKNFDIIPIKNVAPSFPLRAAMNSTQGYVEVGFNIYKDKTVRDIYVIKQYPKNIFAKEAVQAISKYKFKLKPNNIATNHRNYQPATQRIEFKLKGNIPYISTEKFNNVNKQFVLAKEGNIEAQHFFIWALKNYPISFNNEIVKPDLTNQWMYELAKQGYTDAQYYLGLTIFNGDNCKKEQQKGFDWMNKSAILGNFDAQYQLYEWIKNKSRSPKDYDFTNTSNHKADYWLQQAAIKGSLIAKFIYAKNIAFSDNISKTDVALALQYLEKYTTIYGNMPQIYQIKAFLLKKLGKRSLAKSSINKAIKLAKKIDWNIVELLQQKKIIKEKNLKN